MYSHKVPFCLSFPPLYSSLLYLIESHAKWVLQRASKEAVNPLYLELYSVFSRVAMRQKCQVPRNGGWPQRLRSLLAVFKATVQIELGNDGFPRFFPHPSSTFEPHGWLRADLWPCLSLPTVSSLQNPSNAFRHSVSLFSCSNRKQRTDLKTSITREGLQVWQVSSFVYDKSPSFLSESQPVSRE